MTFIPFSSKMICIAACSPNKVHVGLCSCHNRIINETMKSIILNENNTQITIDNKEYILVPVNFSPGVTASLKEPELKTFEDCWNKVIPRFFIDNANEIKSYGHDKLYESSINQLPTEKTAKQIQAAIKLFVVKQALQEDWEPCTGDCGFYVIYDNGLVIQEHGGKFGINPYSFKSLEISRKAIDIAKDIWLEYYGIENNQL